MGLTVLRPAMKINLTPCAARRARLLSSAIANMAFIK